MGFKYLTKNLLHSSLDLLPSVYDRILIVAGRTLSNKYINNVADFLGQRNITFGMSRLSVSKILIPIAHVSKLLQGEKYCRKVQPSG